jgi:DNA-binding transcriptional MerR regulator
VSDLLGVPRPTLYRYLKEYSIPYQRRSGRISIPEESIERIRRVREMHDEGLGTEAVRKRIQDGDSVEIDWIAERFDQLSEALESSQRSVSRSDDNVSSRQALHIILARQSVMLQAIYNLNEMMEELMAVNGRPRRNSGDLFDDTAVQATMTEDFSIGVPPVAHNNGMENHPAVPGTSTVSPQPQPVIVPYHHDGFGRLARRRRRTAIVVGAILLLVVCVVAWAVVGAPFGL